MAAAEQNRPPAEAQMAQREGQNYPQEKV